MRLLVAAVLALLCGPAHAETLVRFGWCGPVISTAAAPIAIAQKMGWFAEGGIKVQMMIFREEGTQSTILISPPLLTLSVSSDQASGTTTSCLDSPDGCRA